MPVCNSHVSCLVCTVLLLVLCSIAGCSSYPSPAAAPSTTAAAPAASTGGNTITMKNFAFNPPSLTIRPGTTVTWVNQDSATHTVVSDTGAPEAFSSASLQNGGMYTYTFTAPGTYSYHCSIHPSMKGTITVQA